MKILTSGLLTISLLGFCATVMAEESVKMITDHVPSASELGNLLFKNKTEHSQEEDKEETLSRSISFKKKEIEATPPSQQPQAIGLLINFESGKDSIMPDSFPVLENMAKALADHPASSVKIEGHTDAFGSPKANMELSKRRAASVKKYLVEKFNIANNRLIDDGFGEEQPLTGIDPYDGQNRRVQFREVE
jgi:outer membrane protein OmpA-like peptidoglycan-associated protein